MTKRKNVSKLKLAIMQPYFFPYIGYWQLMNCVDEFVVYDNVEYVKQGWINRNRYLCNGKPKYFTLPLVRDSDFLDVNMRCVSQTYLDKGIYNKIKSAYHKAPFFDECFNLISEIYEYSERNLFDFLFRTINAVKKLLDIQTPVLISSQISDNKDLKGEQRVIDICVIENASCYVNPIGGVNLYNEDNFKSMGVEIRFLKSRVPKYEQFGEDFVPSLSIIDVLMFNGIDGTKKMLDEYDIFTTKQLIKLDI